MDDVLDALFDSGALAHAAVKDQRARGDKEC